MLERHDKNPKSGTMDTCLTQVGEDLEAFAPHEYTTTMQYAFSSAAAASVATNPDGTTLVIQMDFSENYRFKLQDEIQSRYWNTSSCSVHVMCARSWDGLSHVIGVCDTTDHDATVVLAMQRAMFSILPLDGVKKLIYITDGPSGQYKNRNNFLQLCRHEEDFGVPAEWHFMATSHGKSICDGVGGNNKTETRRFVTQRKDAEELFVNAHTYVAHAPRKNVQLIEMTDEMIEAERRLSASRPTSKTVPGTRDFHCIKPIGSAQPTAIRAWRVSCSCDTCACS